MTHVSPTAYCVWSALSVALGGFLLGHLWRFDRFKCLKWSSGPYSGAFKRIMTYTYLLSIPLIMVYSFGYTYIKYKEGFTVLPGGGYIPTPYFLWPQSYQKAIFPLNLIFALAWSFEMITHLEELCFWLFLVSAGPSQPDWFRSVYFKIWAFGALVALSYMPLVTTLYRWNPLICEAHMFLAGSIGDLVLTVSFIPILFTFPKFLKKVKKEGVDNEIMVRLRKFYELNVVRIIFRFLFVLPLFALGVDGVRGHEHHLNENAFWTDLFSIMAALGCAFSSVCTLLIFFPRSYEAEYQAHEASLIRTTQTRSTRSRSRTVRERGHDRKRNNSRTLSIRPRSQLRRQPTDPTQVITSTDSSSSSTPQAMGRQTPFGLDESGQSVKSLGGSTTKETYLLTDSPVHHSHALPDDPFAHYPGSLAQKSVVLTDASSFHWTQLKGTASGSLASFTPYHIPPPPEGTGKALSDDVYDSWTDAKDDLKSMKSMKSLDTDSASLGVTVLPEMRYAYYGAHPTRKPSLRAYGHGSRSSKTGRENNDENAISADRTASRRDPKCQAEGDALGLSGVVATALTTENLQRHTARQSRINPLIHNFMSPIDLMDPQSQQNSVRKNPANWA